MIDCLDQDEFDYAPFADEEKTVAAAKWIGPLSSFEGGDFAAGLCLPKRSEEKKGMELMAKLLAILEKHNPTLKDGSPCHTFYSNPTSILPSKEKWVYKGRGQDATLSECLKEMVPLFEAAWPSGALAQRCLDGNAHVDRVNTMPMHFGLMWSNGDGGEYHIDTHAAEGLAIVCLKGEYYMHFRDAEDDATGIEFPVKAEEEYFILPGSPASTTTEHKQMKGNWRLAVRIGFEGTKTMGKPIPGKPIRFREKEDLRTAQVFLSSMKMFAAYFMQLRHAVEVAGGFDVVRLKPEISEVDRILEKVVPIANGNMYTHLIICMHDEL